MRGPETLERFECQHHYEEAASPLCAATCEASRVAQFQRLFEIEKECWQSLEWIIFDTTSLGIARDSLIQAEFATSHVLVGCEESVDRRRMPSGLGHLFLLHRKPIRAPGNRLHSTKKLRPLASLLRITSQRAPDCEGYGKFVSGHCQISVSTKRNPCDWPLLPYSCLWHGLINSASRSRGEHVVVV